VRDSQQFSEYGLTPELPQVDFARLLARTQQIVYTIHEKKQLHQTMVNAGIAVFSDVGQAAFRDEHSVQLPNGEILRGEKFILCVGGQPRRLDFPGSGYALTHQDIWSLKTLPRSVIVVGAAATGCQLASIFAAFGSQVTLLETAERILPQEDISVSLALQRAFHKRGIQILTGIAPIERLERREKQMLLFTQHSGESTHLESEAVVLAVGWPGNLQGLGLEAAGVATRQGYIPVDDYLRTTVPHIFAAGDITGRMGLVQRAGYDARIAAENAVLGLQHPYRHQIVPHGGFTDPEYGSVGLTEEQARKQDEVVIAQVPFANLDRAVIDGRTEGFCKLIVSSRNHRFLGAHVVGEDALEIIHIVATGMAAGMRVEQMAELELAYPTYCASVGLAARQIVRELGILPISPEWRSIGRQYPPEWESPGPP
jgi:dihydrolipoamide dehydrogenase